MKRIKLTLLLLLTLTISMLQAQETPLPSPTPAPPRPASPPSQPFRDRLFFGGNLGLNFGSLTFINVSPVIGYRITDDLGAGLGPSYSYYRDNRDRNFTFETHTYGGRVFAQHRVFESFLAYAEYEMLNMEVPNLLFTELVRENISSLLLGGGYGMPIGGGGSAAFIMVLFNVLDSDYVVYENPIIRAGFNFGF